MCPRRSSFKRLLRYADDLRTFLRVCWRYAIDLCLMNLPNRLSLKRLLKVYTQSKILLWIKPYFSWENLPKSCEARRGAGARRLLCHKVNLLSCVARQPLCQSKSTELWSTAAVIPQSKSSEMWSSAAPFHHDLWYFPHWTNEHFSSTRLFIRKNVTSPQ